MKKVVILLIAIFAITACSQVEIGNPQDPFVVQKITNADDYGVFLKYTDGTETLVMPAGMYNEGDTIDFKAFATMQRAYSAIAKPKWNIMSVQDTASTGLETPYMHVDSILLPDGITMRFVPESNKLEVGFDYGVLFNAKRTQ